VQPRATTGTTLGSEVEQRDGTPSDRSTIYSYLLLRHFLVWSAYTWWPLRSVLFG
jgi:hypothetical protein